VHKIQVNIYSAMDEREVAASKHTYFKFVDDVLIKKCYNY
jgi:hypothetical protein